MEKTGKFQVWLLLITKQNPIRIDCYGLSLFIYYNTSRIIIDFFIVFHPNVNVYDVIHKVLSSNNRTAPQESHNYTQQNKL